MAASSAGALKARIEALGLGLAAYRDRPSEDTAKPYVSIVEGIDLRPDESGDNGAGATGRELVQVDLWQQYRHPTTNALTESYTLAADLAKGLHGVSLANVGSSRVYNCRVQGSVRLLERDTNTVHSAITVELSRVL